MDKPAIPTPAIDLELKRKEQSDILAELESIQDLLNGTAPDDIPILSNALEESVDSSVDSEFSDDAFFSEDIPTLAPLPETALAQSSERADVKSDESKLRESKKNEPEVNRPENAPHLQTDETKNIEDLDHAEPVDTEAMLSETNETPEQAELDDSADATTNEFAQSSGTHFQRPHKTVKASGDNPFLPQHIRERLNSSSYKKSAAEAAGKPNTKAQPETNTDHYQDIIDELVAQYLPELEKALREKLTLLMKDSDNN